MRVGNPRSEALAQAVRKLEREINYTVLAVGRHQFSQRLDARGLFDHETLRFVVGDHDDK